MIFTLMNFIEPAPVPNIEMMMNHNRAPPPSPPMPPPPMPPDPVIAAPIPSNGSAFGISNDPRSALMEAIRSGTTLKVN
jgi:hypothetical protein